VVDNSPLFKMQAFNWLSTIIGSGSAHPTEILVNLVQGTDPAFESVLGRFGVTVQWVEPFGTGDAAYCNKLMQLECPQLHNVDCAVLCDADLAFAGDIRPWMTTKAVRAKVVDLPSPPLEMLDRLYATTGLSAEPRIANTSFAAAVTYETNCNGGLYVIPTQWLRPLAKAWIKWARFVFEKNDILGPYRKHADQIGFCFAMLELSLPFEPLPEALNFPTHLSPEICAALNGVKPLVLHYHWRLDQSGCLLPLGLVQADSSIANVNEVIRNSRHTHFDNQSFWDYRYACHAELGSGVGSRADSLAYRRDLLYPIVFLFARKEILDVGCGDLEVMAEAEADRYTGLDISPAAISLARTKRPDWRLLVGDVSAIHGQVFDLVMCGCVLIHMPEREVYENTVRRLVDACRDTLIIEAYNGPPTLTSEITFYHEPVSETLSRDPRIGQIKVIGSYSSVHVVLARRVEALPENTWHIPLELLAQGLSRSSYPDLLRQVVDFAFEKLGFFPSTSARMHEYPWAIAESGEVQGLRLLDVGAGTNPLPLWFASRGAAMVTVDNHSLIRTMPDRQSWNEWGFFDYATLDANIISVHADIADAHIQGPFDLVYSISVLEHVRAQRRRAIFTKISSLLRPKGRLLLTLDLIPGTRQLWNLFEGQVVEAASDHGDLDDVVSELTTQGFQLDSCETVVGIPESRTDVGLITASKSSQSRLGKKRRLGWWRPFFRVMG